MKILFLDDMQPRHEAFLRNHIGHDVFPVYTAAEAIRALDKQVWDIASLDHDLAEEHYLQFEAAEYSPGTGMDVVDHICSMLPDRRPRYVFVHSLNTRGVEMVNRLLDVGVRAMRAPFRSNLRYVNP